MKTVTFAADFSHDLDGRWRKTWPAGWRGTVADGVAAAAHAAGALEPDPDPDPGASAPPAAEVPEDWESFNADATLDLARRLGAGKDVKTKAAAVEFIAGRLTGPRALL